MTEDPGLTVKDVADELRVMAHEFNQLREPLQVHYPMWRNRPLSNVFIELAEALEKSVPKASNKGGFHEEEGGRAIGVMERERIIDADEDDKWAEAELDAKRWDEAQGYDPPRTAPTTTKGMLKKEKEMMRTKALQGGYPSRTKVVEGEDAEKILRKLKENEEKEE